MEAIKPNLATVRRRWDAWWHCGPTDRPVVNVTCPLDKPRADIPPQSDLDVDPTTQWTDETYLARRMLEQTRVTYYGGDAMPIASNPISAGHALYFGARPVYNHSTVSIDPAPCADGSFPSLDGWEQSPAWQMAQRHIAALAAASQGRWFTAPFFGNGPTDTLAAVRGFEEFYVDLALNRDWVIGSVRQMTDILRKVYRRLADLARAPGTPEGYGNILGVWASQPNMAFDADIIYNISPRDFQEIVLPPMIEAMADFPLRVFHLDGPGALRHLDALLGVKELHAIQWVQGPGNGGAVQWLEVIQSIQAAGKAVMVYCEPSEIEALGRRLRPEGLLLSTWTANETDARRLVDRVAKAFGSRSH